ncbi:MAG: TOBE domain-containing protein, partial [Actinobacteria bacterium]|nr:TOBE domain-containing protein [Actinomycetota bacterium]
RPEKITIEREEGESPSDRNSITGLLRMSSYIGVSHQYKVEGPEGTDLTVYVQNLGATPVPQPGERVRLVWRPENTFAVKPSEAPVEEEER